VVLSDKGLYFIDGEGRVLPPHLAADSARCVWFPDGKRLLIKHTAAVEKWDQAAGLFEPQEVARIQTEAAVLKERVLAYEGDWDAFKFEPEAGFTPAMTAGLLLYLRDRISEGLPAKLGPKWEDLAKIKPDVSEVQVCTLTDAELQRGAILLRTLNPVSALRISPNGKIASFLMPVPSGADHPPGLHVLPVSGGSARLVARHVAEHYDWSQDGRSLVYIAGTASKEESSGNVQLGVLGTITVAGPDDELLQKWIDQKDRVGLLFDERLAVRWLSDGRLFFSSVEVTLPATTRDMPQQWSLFALDPRMPASVIRLLGRDFGESLNGGLPVFQLSPDEKRVLLSGPENSLLLYDLAGGETTKVVGSDQRDSKLQSLPSWRNNSEICLVTPVAKGGESGPRLRVVLWREGETQVLSDSWPEEMKSGLLETESK
jgi:hypothetical protein